MTREEQKQQEIEITPEMIEAGREAYAQYAGELSSDQGSNYPITEMLTEVFRAMGARLKCSAR